MQLLKVFPNNINMRAIDAAVDALSQGRIIVYPTDTLYALGCNALNQRAIERLCRVKGLNPDKNMLSIVCADIAQAAEYARIDNVAFKTLKHYLPGPFTFILPASTRLPKVFKARKTVGIRVPDNPIACALASAQNAPILTTSVSVEDYGELADAEAVAMHYADVAALAIDGGKGGLRPSTVVDLTDSTDPQVIREGAGNFEG